MDKRPEVLLDNAFVWDLFRMFSTQWHMISGMAVAEIGFNYQPIMDLLIHGYGIEGPPLIETIEKLTVLERCYLSVKGEAREIKAKKKADGEKTDAHSTDYRAR